MVYKIPPGGGGKPYLASGLNHLVCMQRQIKMFYLTLAVTSQKKKKKKKKNQG